MGALRDPQELREVPAIAVCAQCGDPDCPGHDFLERSGERPIHRLLPWEDGETPPLRALWRTSMATASDLELWVRASRSAGNGVGPAMTFALGCEVVAVAATTLPMAALIAALAWWWFHDVSIVVAVAATFARIGLVFVPTMIVIHLVHQAVIARTGGKLGAPIARAATMRAGLYACGWDLATGPAGILAPLFRLDLRGARARIAGNSTLYRDATRVWLRDVHGVEDPADVKRATRATLPFMIALLLAACGGVGWAILAAFA